jgi:hypothetical protein
MKLVGALLLLAFATAAFGAPADFRLRMTRGSCLGWCPVYRLTIDANGVVTFEGRENTSVVGIHKRALTSDELHQVIRAVRGIDFFTLGDYSSRPVCRKLTTDAPAFTITVRINGREKAVRHYAGCHGFDVERQLLAFEDRIDELAGVEAWKKYDKRLARRRMAVRYFGGGCRAGVDCEQAATELVRQALVLFRTSGMRLRIDRDGSVLMTRKEGAVKGRLRPDELNAIRDLLAHAAPNTMPVISMTTIVARDGELLAIDSPSIERRLQQLVNDRSWAAAP